MTVYQPIAPDLNAIRAIVIGKLNDAMVQAQRLASPDVAIPSSLRAACLWLADKAEFPATESEEYFGWTPAQCLRFLYRLSPQQRAEEVGLGERVLFEGSARRAPLIDTSLTDGSPDPARKTLGCRFDREVAA